MAETAKAGIIAQAKSDSPRRFGSIDGLRGFACMLVLFGHCQMFFHEPLFLSWHIWNIALSPIYMLDYCSFGVDLFFVLSGFCLFYPILSRPDNPVDWRKFFSHRIQRIIPPYWGALLLFATISFLTRHYRMEPFYREFFPAFPSWKWMFYSTTLISYSYNPSFWSLAVEWRWYLLIPLLYLLWKRNGSAGVFLLTFIACLAGLFVLPLRHDQKLMFVFQQLPDFMPLFAFGIYAADLQSKKAHSDWEKWLVKNARWGAIGSVLLVLAIFRGGFLMAQAQTLLRVMSTGPLAFFMVLATLNDNLWRTVFTWRPLTAVGIFSYSVYVFNQPIIVLAVPYIVAQHWSPWLQLAVHQTVLPLAIIGGAYVFHRIFEYPFLRMKPSPVPTSRTSELQTMAQSTIV